MIKSRYTETQIIKVLKEVEGGRLVKRFAGNTGYPMPPIITGSQNTVAWKPLTLCGSRSLKRKIAD